MLRGAARPGPARRSPSAGVSRLRGMAEAEAVGGAGEAPAPAEGGAELTAVIGATVPTGFELTAAEEVQEKLGSASRISRDRGKIYFEVPARGLPQVRAGGRPAPLPSPLPSPPTPARSPLARGRGRRPCCPGCD